MILNNIREASDSENEAWQRIAMLLGWNTLDVGIDPYEDVGKDQSNKSTNTRNVKKRTVKKRK